MTPCAIWAGQRKPNGYGYIDLYESGDGSRRRVYAHRAAIDAPSGVVVRHLCHNPACVNPEHLALGSQADNADDMVQADRSTARVRFEHVAAIRTCVAAGVSTATLASLAGVSASAIKRIATGETFRSATGPLTRGRGRGARHLSARLTEADVRDIRSRVAAGEPQAAVSRAYGVTPQAIHNIVTRKTWRHVE